jgi:hypothetical protein
MRNFYSITLVCAELLGVKRSTPSWVSHPNFPLLTQIITEEVTQKKMCTQSYWAHNTIVPIIHSKYVIYNLRATILLSHTIFLFSLCTQTTSLCAQASPSSCAHRVFPCTNDHSNFSSETRDHYHKVNLTWKLKTIVILMHDYKYWLSAPHLHVQEAL